MVSQKREAARVFHLAYFLGLSLIHVPGALLYLDAEESNYTRIGFEQTIIGMVAFLGGVMIARFFFLTVPGQQASAGQPQGFTPQSLPGLDRLALLYIVVGGFVYFVVLRFAASIPSATAFVVSARLAHYGRCLSPALGGDGKPKSAEILVHSGSVAGASPRYRGSRRLCRIRHVLGFGHRDIHLRPSQSGGWDTFCSRPVVCFVGLSVFVNYMIARDEIRQLVWYQQAGIGTEFQRIARRLFRKFRMARSLKLATS